MEDEIGSFAIEHPPVTCKLKASYQFERAGDLCYVYACRQKWKWSWLWNWKAVWRAYQCYKLEQKLISAMADEIRKELDDVMKEVIKDDELRKEIDDEIIRQIREECGR